MYGGGRQQRPFPPASIFRVGFVRPSLKVTGHPFKIRGNVEVGCCQRRTKAFLGLNAKESRTEHFPSFMSAAHQVPVVPKVDKSLPEPTVAARGPAVWSKLLTDRSWGNAADA